MAAEPPPAVDRRGGGGDRPRRPAPHGTAHATGEPLHPGTRHHRPGAAATGPRACRLHRRGCRGRQACRAGRQRGGTGGGPRALHRPLLQWGARRPSRRRRGSGTGDRSDWCTTPPGEHPGLPASRPRTRSAGIRRTTWTATAGWTPASTSRSPINWPRHGGPPVEPRRISAGGRRVVGRAHSRART
ncbi:hypothetical protein HBB16_17005 [Pseudonocardia sp. MCCB 268]|nr:hypothetical protein [Pseudonocardia cytotoxica]